MRKTKIEKLERIKPLLGLVFISFFLIDMMIAWALTCTAYEVMQKDGVKGTYHTLPLTSIMFFRQSINILEKFPSFTMNIFYRHLLIGVSVFAGMVFIFYFRGIRGENKT